MVVQKFIDDGAKANIKRWMQAVELTACRAGLLLCGDLEIAKKIIAAEPQLPGRSPAAGQAEGAHPLLRERAVLRAPQGARHRDRLIARPSSEPERAALEGDAARFSFPRARSSRARGRAGDVRRDRFPRKRPARRRLRRAPGYILVIPSRRSGADGHRGGGGGAAFLLRLGDHGVDVEVIVAALARYSAYVPGRSRKPSSVTSTMRVASAETNERSWETKRSVPS